MDNNGTQAGKSDRKISPTDPAASYTAAPGGPAFYAYSTNYLADTKHGIIVDVEPTTANCKEEVESARTMIERVEQRFGIKPQRLIGDTAYGAAHMLGWLVEEKHIAPHVPVWDKTEHKDGTFSRSDFLWDERHNEYRCPAGKALRSRQRNFKKLPTVVTKGDRINYRASKYDCTPCPLKQCCCPNTPARRIAHSIHESARDEARRIARSDEYKQSRKDRKKVEQVVIACNSIKNHITQTHRRSN